MTNKTTLYKSDKKGKTRVWSAWADNGVLYTEFGILDGKMQQSSVVCTPKNVGRANETTAIEQAELELASLILKQRDKRYVDSVEETQELIIRPMLAKKYSRSKAFDMDGNALRQMWVQPKLDGVRALIYKHGDDVQIKSRNGKDYNVPHIADEVLKAFDGNTDIILDGELYADGVGFQQITSWVKKLQPGTENIKFNMFDVAIPSEQELDQSARFHLMDALFDNSNMVLDNIRKVDTIEIKTEEELHAYQSKFVSDGYEGTILRVNPCVYLFGHRSSDLFKVKDFDDDEFLVVDYTSGVGKMTDCVIWICKTPQGQPFKVTPKISYEEKLEYYKNADKYIGECLKVKYFGLSDDGIPRFPIGLGFRMEEDM